MPTPLAIPTRSDRRETAGAPRRATRDACARVERDGPARGASDIAEARVGLVQRRANATSLFDEA